MTISNNSQKIDFIHYLPNEIAYIIFSFLSFRERIHCLEISSTWRHYLLGWPLFWSNLDDPECDLGRDLLPYKQYIKNDSVQRVKIQELNVDQQRRALDFLVQLKSRSIQSIIFSYRDHMRESFYNLLACSGHSITNIDITLRDYAPCSHEDLLIHCPNLESIKYQARSNKLISRNRDPSREPSLLQQQQELTATTTTTKSMVDQQQLQRLKLKSLYLKCTASDHQLLNGDINIPNIEYINIIRSTNNSIMHIEQRGWPQLRYLHFTQVNLTEEGVKSLVAAIPNIPLLVSLILKLACTFSAQTNELYSAIGNLEHLQELCIISRQIIMRAPLSGRLPAPTYHLHVTEEGYLSLLNGKCRRTLQKLQLSPITALTHRMLAAIPDNHYHSNGEQQQLTLLNLEQMDEQGEENNNNEGLLTDEGLCSFASTMSRFKMDLVRLKFGKEFDLKTYKYMEHKMGPNCIIAGPNRTGKAKCAQVSDTGTWTIRNGIFGPEPRCLPSASDQVKHYASEQKRCK